MLGNRIKELRKKEHLTQIQLAEKLGIAQSTLGMIESNKRPAGRKTLLKLAEYFGVTVDYLLSKDDNIEKINTCLSIKEQDKIDKEAQKILDDMSLAFSKNKDKLSNEDYFAIENALRSTLEAIKIKNKTKFTPQKYK
ncbi:helix-turn-helix domain-containing protein [Clostridium chrysemydis]|uniref:helix-turn-helix domain-containing protein n=1 Tax=Clostridium chrysemydis TaxID=2665504 RepID=UPI0018847AE6|nr:helix-turn-helix transcriptional regulator [Clostridium chrysemydis]